MTVSGHAAQGGAPARVARGIRHPRWLIGAGVVILLCAAVLAGLRWASQPKVSERPLSAGQQVTLASGLTLTAPSGTAWQGATQESVTWPAAWLHRDRSAWSEQVDAVPVAGTGRPHVLIRTYSGEPWQSLAHMRFAFEAGIPPLAYTSPDGLTKAYWQTAGRKLLIVTHLAGHSVGVIMVLGLPLQNGMPPSAKDASAVLATLWRDLAIRGAAQPVVTGQ